MNKDEALRLALDWLEKIAYVTAMDYEYQRWAREAITAIKEDLAQTEQEPVAYINVEQRKLEWAKYMSWDTPTVVNLPKIPLYTTPPRRTWVGLTYEEQRELYKKHEMDGWGHFYNAIEAKLKEKNK
jgi:hypothetical protein